MFKKNTGDCGQLCTAHIANRADRSWHLFINFSVAAALGTITGKLSSWNCGGGFQ
jgi:hypothetical protein